MIDSWSIHDSVDPRCVRLVNVHHDSRLGYPRNIYATLVDAKTGETIINATLSYVLTAVANRGYRLVGDKV
jgi:hypothetical protein